MSVNISKPFNFTIKGKSITGFTGTIPENLVIPSSINKVNIERVPGE